MENVSKGRKYRVRNLRIKIGASIVTLSLCGFLLYKETIGPKALVSVFRSSIHYDNDNQVTGSLTYQEADEHLRIVILEQDDILFQKLVYVESYLYRGLNQIHYIDFEKNWSMFTYQESVPLGLDDSEGKLQILQEESFMPYLLKEMGLQEDYEAADILDIFTHIPDMRDSVKESLKEKNRLN